MTNTRRALRARKETMSEQQPQGGKELSRNLALLAVSVIIVLAIVGSVVLYIHRPEAVATFIQNIILLLGILTSTLLTLLGIGKAVERIGVVQKQTNGTLSSLREQLAEKDQQLADAARREADLSRQLPPTE